MKCLIPISWPPMRPLLDQHSLQLEGVFLPDRPAPYSILFQPLIFSTFLRLHIPPSSETNSDRSFCSPDNDSSSSLTKSPLFGRGTFISIHCNGGLLLSVNAKRGVWLGASSRECNDSTDEHMYGIGIASGRLQKYLFPLPRMRSRDWKKQAMQASGRTLRLHRVWVPRTLRRH